MINNGKDDLETTAEYYNDKIAEHLNTLREMLDRPRQLEAGLTYREYLDIDRVYQYFKEAMILRSGCGTHSRSGRDKFMHIGHPDKYPAPAEREDPALV
jgi:hypothetical protein